MAPGVHMLYISDVPIMTSITHRKKVPLKYPILVSASLNSSCILNVLSMLATLSYSIPSNKVVYILFSFVVRMQIIFNANVWFWLILLVCLLICPLLCWSFVVWQFILSICSHSQSNIPSNAGPSPDTTKKGQQYVMSLLIIVTLLIPMCCMDELLQVHNTIFVNGLFSLFMFECGKAICKFWWAYIMLPLLPVSICLYVSAFWLLFLVNFAIFITDLMLWKLKILDLIM